MKRMGVLAVTVAVLFTWMSSAGALEVKDASKAPPGWWEMTAPTAVPPQYFDRVLSAYGLTLQDASKAPPTYARKVGDSVVWETAPRTYTPTGGRPDPVGLRGDADRRFEGAADVRARGGRQAGLRTGDDRVGSQGDRPDSQGVPVGPDAGRWAGRAPGGPTVGPPGDPAESLPAGWWRGGASWPHAIPKAVTAAARGERRDGRGCMVTICHIMGGAA